MSSTPPGDSPEDTITAPDDPWAPRSSNQTKDLHPQAAAVLKALRDQLRGKFFPRSGWHCSPLSHANYRDLVHRIYHDEPIAVEAFFVMKARYDYNAGDEKFILRSSNAVHGFFSASVQKRIQEAIHRLSEDHPSVRQVLKPTRMCGCITLELDVGEDVRTARAPDLQLRHKDAGYWPTFVLEITFKEKREDVYSLGYDYLRGSGGLTKAVVFLHVKYAPRGCEPLPGSKDAAVAIWRTCQDFHESDGKVYNSPQQVHHEVRICSCFRQQVFADTPLKLFRDEDGKPAPGALRFPLTDFAPPEAFEVLCDPVFKELSISIPYADLCTDLGEAEHIQRSMDSFQDDFWSGRIPREPWNSREDSLKRLAAERNESPDGADQKRRRRIDNENEDKVIS